MQLSPFEFLRANFVLYALASLFIYARAFVGNFVAANCFEFFLADLFLDCFTFVFHYS